MPHKIFWGGPPSSHVFPYSKILLLDGISDRTGMMATDQSLKYEIRWFLGFG